MTITTRPIPYEDEGTSLEGVLAWDASMSGERPGILLVHGGAGLDDHAREQARRYAALGYAVLACDMFGEGVTGVRDSMVARLSEFRDEPELMRRRAVAGLNALASCPEVGGRLGAVGFCFGGLVALTLARFGTDLAGVVSMHGSLATKLPARPGEVKAKVLACHGAIDPFVPLADVTPFAEEMTHAEADWQLIMYGGAKHGFTHRGTDPDVLPGVAYHEPTDRRSFAAARSFFEEVFAS